LDWLDSVAPLPVRPSSPVLLRSSSGIPVKVQDEIVRSEFTKLNSTFQEIVDKRKLLEDNIYLLERQQKSKQNYFGNESDSIKEKVSKAILESKTKPIDRPLKRTTIRGTKNKEIGRPLKKSAQTRAPIKARRQGKF
jgi:hypothetical protein